MSENTDGGNDSWMGEDLFGDNVESRPEDVEEVGDDGEDAEITPEEADDDSLDENTSDNDSWNSIYAGYADSNRETRAYRQRAVEQLSSEYNLLAVHEPPELYRYDTTAGIYRPDGERIIRKTLEEQLKKYNTRRETAQIIWKAKQSNQIEQAEFNPPEVICLQNGVLDVGDPADPVLNQHDPKYRFTRQLPFSYRPNATCPTLKQFLRESVHKDDISKLQEFVGYAVVRHWDNQYQKALLLLGPTDGGKSTFLNVVQALLGKENVSNESFSELVTNNHSSVQLHGNLANIYNDLDSKVVKHTGLFKNLTGNDRISAHAKYEPKFQFRPTQKLLFAANDVPDVNDAGDAFHNRWVIVRFPNTIPDEKKDRNLEDNLKDELSGIFNWALEGYSRLVANDGFSKERSIDEKRSFWCAYGDSVERFVENGPVKIEAGEEIPKDELYQAYELWCDVHENPVKTKSVFSRRLLQKYNVETCQPKIDGTRVRCYRGIKIIEDFEEI